MKQVAMTLAISFGAVLVGCDTAPKAPPVTPTPAQPAQQMQITAPAMPTAPAPTPTPSAPVAVNTAEFDQNVCTRFDTLCGQDPNHTHEQCLRDMGELRRNMGPQAVQGTAECVTQAQSCAAAAGCIAGGALRGVGGQFLQGFGSALSR